MKALMLLCSLVTAIPVAENAFMNDVAVEITGADSDGTLIGKVTLPDGRDLAEELTKAGLARWDKRNHPEAKGLARLEQDARASGLGLWAEASDDADDEDVDKEVLVQNELAGKNAHVMLTSAGN